MKKISLCIVSVVLAAGFFACNPDSHKQTDSTADNRASVDTTAAAQPPTEPSASVAKDGPQMTFTKTEYDFGNIKEGDVIKHTFTFTNTGNAPLVIENATAPCGCTVPSWPKEPVAVGATGEINVQFNSKGKVGQQNKVVTITANTQPDITTVTIKGNVEPGVSQMNGPVKQ